MQRGELAIRSTTLAALTTVATGSPSAGIDRDAITMADPTPTSSTEARAMPALVSISVTPDRACVHCRGKHGLVRMPIIASLPLRRAPCSRSAPGASVYSVGTPSENNGIWDTRASGRRRFVAPGGFSRHVGSLPGGICRSKWWCWFFSVLKNATSAWLPYVFGRTAASVGGGRHFFR